MEEEEFRDALRMRYGAEPEGLVAKCDGCGQKFSVEHALSCMRLHMNKSRVQ